MVIVSVFTDCIIEGEQCGVLLCTQKERLPRKKEKRDEFVLTQIQTIPARREVKKVIYFFTNVLPLHSLLMPRLCVLLGVKNHEFMPCPAKQSSKLLFVVQLPLIDCLDFKYAHARSRVRTCMCARTWRHEIGVGSTKERPNHPCF